tara:strand:- start:47 stop:571 length:525 start_codon:yes stop_codon:yes gene_type:complete
MPYTEKERYILGINTLWILYPLIDVKPYNILLESHTLTTVLFSLLFWCNPDNLLNYYIDVIMSSTFIVHIMLLKDNTLFDYILLCKTVILLYYTSKFKANNKNEYALIVHLTFRKCVCYLFCIKFNDYDTEHYIFFTLFYFIYTFYLVSKPVVDYIYGCFELVGLIIITQLVLE